MMTLLSLALPTSTSTIILWFFASWLIYNRITAILTARRVRALARAHGCKPAPSSSPSFFPLAIFRSWQLVARIIRSKQTGEDILDDILLPNRPGGGLGTNTAVQLDGSVSVQTSDPANLQAILATQFKDFEIGKRRIAQFYPVLGDSIFSTDGSAWEHSRALFRPQFNREQINDLEITEMASKELIQALGPVDEKGWTGTATMFPLLLNFTLDTATDFLFGESVQSQRHAFVAATSKAKSLDDGSKLMHAASTLSDRAASQQFSKDFTLISECLLSRIRNQGFYWLADGREFRAAIRRLRDFMEHFVERTMHPAAIEKNATKKYNLLAALAEQTQNHEELRNQTAAILFAGRDTTAALLGWCFVRLSLHPDIFADLRATTLAAFSADKPITFAGLKACRPLQHFLSEVLRLHPTVPFNNRVAVRDTTLPVGGGPDGKSPIVVAKGQLVAFSVYMTHRRTDLWGDDALEFRPGRWAERTIPAWQFLPFSGGPRICLGQQFALTEAAYLLVRVLREFDQIIPADSEEMKRMRKGFGLTMWPGDDARVRLHRADAAPGMA